MRIVARPPDAEAFEPFGGFLVPPDRAGERVHFSPWLEPVHDLSLQSHLNHVPASDLPLTLDQVEHHPHAAQLFLPVGVSRYVVTVLPSRPDGSPDEAGALAFVVPGRIGVAYRPGVWHAGITVLDHAASFAVHMWRGATDDDVFASIPTLRIDGVEA